MADEAPNNNTNTRLAYEPPDEERPASVVPTEPVLETEVPSVKTLDYSPPPPEHDPYAAFRLPVFQQYLSSFMLATLGTQIMSVALQWELAAQTKSPLILGFLGGMQALPVILLALFAGHVSDIYSRKAVLMVTQVILVICPLALAALAFKFRSSPHYVSAMFGIVLINAIALTFARPARQAYLPQLVPKEIFSNAITWNATTFELSSITGPAIGGLIIWKLNVVSALVLSATCTLVCLGLTALMPSIPAPAKKERFSFDTLIAGVKFVFGHDYLLPALTLDLFAVLFGGATYLLPFFAERMGVGSFGFGLLRSAPSLGAVSMAILMAHLPPMKNAGRSLMLAVIGFGAATIVFGLSNNIWLSMAMLFLTGAFDNVSVVVRHTLVQMMTPDSMRGRVSAVNQVFIGSSNELGGMESGLTARALGLVGSVVFGGIGTILVVILIALKWPKLRKFGSLQQAHA